VVRAGDAFVDVKAFSRERARPLTPDDRREAILDAVVPLLRDHGRDVSSRQLAEAAGIAEGTLFRAFGDKESIIAAAIQRILDPTPVRNALRGIDPDEPTDAKVRQVLQLLRERFAEVVQFMTALRMQGPPPKEYRSEDEDWVTILGGLFRPGELAIPVADLGQYLRLLAFGSAIPMLNTAHPFTHDELAAIVLRGVLPAPTEGTS
jgi:AcrR family transcriptional regulator